MERRDRIQDNRRVQPDDDVAATRDPAIEGQLTYRKQAQTQAQAARRHLLGVQDDLDDLAGAEQHARETYQWYAELFQKAQTAQAQNGAAKSGETQASELWFRFFVGIALVIGFMGLAVIQSTASSAFVVLVLFVVPVICYLVAKGRALVAVYRSLPTRWVGDPVVLREAVDRAWRDHCAAAKLAAKPPSREMLLVEYQQAAEEVTYWERESAAAEAHLRSLYSEINAEKRQQQSRQS